MGSIKYLQFITLTAAFSVSFLFFSTTSIAQPKQFDRIVVFGTSLSDSGNAFILLSDPTAFGFGGCDMGTPANVPPYDALDELLIPDGSYARGGHHVTNGATWVEQLARGKGLSGNTRPALKNPGKEASNYAVGGARATDYLCRYNLNDQMTAYLTDFPDEISANTLIVFEIGSNDVRDALASLSYDPTGSEQIITTALYNIGLAVEALHVKGARKFLLMNVPAIGETPAVKTLDFLIPGTAYYANIFAQNFNIGLDSLKSALNGLPGIDVRILDIYSLLYEIIGNPVSYGIVNIDDACVTPNVPPFTCKKPDTYLFWDGIHPTKAVHEIVAQRAAEVLN
ncbi:SGNH/GDSL hydrolase family protein [Desulfocastanea catecholica]